MNTTSHQQTSTARLLDPKVSVAVEALLESARKKEAAALSLIEVIEARLGTPDEQPNDLAAVTQVMHDLMSALQIYMGIKCAETERAVRWMERRKKLREAAAGK